jgi:preprotein translocase subunit YajC
MLITPAFAQAAAPTAGAADLIYQLLPFVLVFVIMYMLILRPQQRRVKAHQEMIKNLRRGDTVVTSGGIIGRISKIIDDSEVEAEIAPNVRVRIARAMVTEVRAKGEPVREEAAS